MNIAEILRDHALSRPDAPAIIDTLRGASRVTKFAALEDAVSRGAALLESHGLKPGDPVLVLQPMSRELYVALLAIFRLRLVAMFLDPSAGGRHIERCCALQAPKAFIGSPKAHLLRLVSRPIGRIPVKFVMGPWLPFAISWAAGDNLSPHSEMAPCPPETPALLTFTSGSTGVPRAAVRTHGFLLAQHRAMSRALRLQPGDVDLATMPIVLLANLATGATSIIPTGDIRYPGSIDPGPVVAQIQKHQPVSSTASPAFFERLALHCAERKLTLPSFRKLFTGGAPVFPRLLDQMQSIAPQADIVAVYGSTEAEPIAEVSRSQIRPDDHTAMLDGRGLLAGPPVEDIRVRILRDRWGTPIGPFTEGEFHATCCPVGDPGEIVVSGDHVLSGYLHGEGDRETKFRVDGVVWHRTGDAGYFDGEGRLWLLGRCAAKIQDKDGVLYPFAAECAVYQDARVRRAAVVAHQGKRVLAVDFYRKENADVEAVRRAVAWAKVEDVHVLDRVPVDGRHNAKIDYPALRTLLERETKK